MEKFKDVKGYEGIYKISEYGTVLRDGNVLKGSIGSRGYRRHALCKNGKSKVFRTHQLVAQAFLNHEIDRYNKVVDHVDNNKLNNHVSNLQVVSARENVSKDRRKGTSPYRGVSWSKSKNRWVATIYYKGRQLSLKQSKCEIKCAYIYNKFIKDNNIV